MPYRSPTPLRYPGGKQKMLPQLEEALRHLLHSATAYHEPFVGGAAVLLWVAEHYPKLPLYANDLDRGVASFWSCVVNRDALRELCARMPAKSEVTVDLFREWKARSPEDEIGHGLRLLLLNRWSDSRSKGDRPYGGWEQKLRKIHGRYSPENLKERLWRCHELLRGRCEVSCEDAKRCIGFCDPELPEDETQAIFLDPPYIIAGADMYHRGMSRQELARLARNLSGVRSPWLMTLDDHEYALTLFSRVKHVTTIYSNDGSRKTNRRVEELLIERTAHHTEEEWDDLTGLRVPDSF